MPKNDDVKIATELYEKLPEHEKKLAAALINATAAQLLAISMAYGDKDKQYGCPGKFEENITPSICNKGMHFCKRASDCFNYYSFDPNNKIAEVIAYGEVSEGGDKCATNKLEVVREISWSELLEIVNMGKGCTGLCNSGDYNSGDWNSGDWNKLMLALRCIELMTGEEGFERRNLND